MDFNYGICFFLLFYLLFINFYCCILIILILGERSVGGVSRKILTSLENKCKRRSLSSHNVWYPLLSFSLFFSSSNFLLYLFICSHYFFAGDSEGIEALEKEKVSFMNGIFKDTLGYAFNVIFYFIYFLLVLVVYYYYFFILFVPNLIRTSFAGAKMIRRILGVSHVLDMGMHFYLI